MLHFNFIPNKRIADKIAKEIKKLKNWADIEKVLIKYKVNPSFVLRAFSLQFFDNIPNRVAFRLMKTFKENIHKKFDTSPQQLTPNYIKINKNKSEIQSKIDYLNQNKSTLNLSEGWVTFKFGCNPQFRNFNVIVGYTYRRRDDTTWVYSSLRPNEINEINNFQTYINSNILFDSEVSQNEGIAFKVFPLTNAEKIESIEEWVKALNNDKVYIYPGYSTYTTLVFSNDSLLDQKVNSTDIQTLDALSFDLGNSCCPPY